MIRNTFQHIPGIGSKSERLLWESGIRCWDDIDRGPSIPLPKSKRRAVREALGESREAMAQGDLRYFSDRLPSNQHWRFFPEFQDSAAYLDIETTGLDRWRCEITTIALYDGRTIRYYVNGRNLDDFPTDIGEYGLIVTYNGKSFDVPFIEETFGIKLPQAHIDLRYVLASAGYTGGLKNCETRLGLDRGDLADIDGYFAVLLWYDYVQNGNPRALETLLAYNIRDTITLETLMIVAFNLKVAGTPFSSARMPMPDLPLEPFGADTPTIEKIKRRFGI